VAKRSAPIADLLRAVYADGAQAYRRAIAAQVEDRDPTAEWDAWEADTAALLFASWALGAQYSLHAAGVSIPKPTAPARFDRDIPDIGVRFKAGPAREVIRRFADLLPITRAKWDALIDNAFQAAGELRKDEANTALTKMMDRSPDLARLVLPAMLGTKPPPVPGQQAATLPEGVQVRRTPGVQAIARGAFFVTGMTAKQATEVKSLLAKVIRGDVTRSVAGKRLERLGVGDFVEQATLTTGTDLTAARLETVYRTNLNRASSQGQLDIVRDEKVQAFVPVMQFSATKDNRTRDTHRAMDGYVATVAQIDAQGINTPGGFNCRCGWKPIPVAIAMAKGWVDDDGQPDYAAIKRHNGRRQALIDTGKFPDAGFVSG
jgi:SPP1 gp7 family putative phage head morphogenesis protein